jgi:hypothetical protein
MRLTKVTLLALLALSATGADVDGDRDDGDDGEGAEEEAWEQQMNSLKSEIMSLSPQQVRARFMSRLQVQDHPGHTQVTRNTDEPHNQTATHRRTRKSMPCYDARQVGFLHLTRRRALRRSPCFERHTRLAREVLELMPVTPGCPQATIALLMSHYATRPCPHTVLYPPFGFHRGTVVVLRYT